MSKSPAERLALLPEEARREFLASLSETEAEDLLYEWDGFHARPEQLPPEGRWEIWLALAGRGFGKTRMGAEWVRRRIFRDGARRVALVAETQKDLEEVMLTGPSGLLSILPPKEQPEVRYKPVRLIFPNGAIALGYNATEPEQLRGPQFDTAWCDELAKWRYARETWDQLQFGLRLGDDPRVLATTTPRSVQLIRDILDGKEGKVAVTLGSTEDNRSNLSSRFLDKIEARYAGTRLGRQELNGELLADLPGALWSYDQLEALRIRSAQVPPLDRIVVAIDPAVTSDEDADDHGIIVAGSVGTPGDIRQEGFVLDDISTHGSPMTWANTAVQAYHAYKADAIVAEVNQGGEMVEQIIRSVDPNIRVIKVRASKSKVARAEPIAALYEQRRVHHTGAFPDLETQMTQITTTGYVGDKSPDRADALVWALTELMIEEQDAVQVFLTSGKRRA